MKMEGRILGTYKKLAVIWRLTPPFLFYSQCRFIPTCSEYCESAVKKYGMIKGLGKGFWRIVRCNPFSRVSLDEV